MTSPAAKLRPRLAQLLAEIRSTLPSHDLREPLCEHLVLSLEAADGRAQSGRDRSRERSEAVRAPIREVLGAAPLTHPTTELIDVVLARLGKDAPAPVTK